MFSVTTTKVGVLELLAIFGDVTFFPDSSFTFVKHLGNRYLRFHYYCLKEVSKSYVTNIHV